MKPSAPVGLGPICWIRISVELGNKEEGAQEVLTSTMAPTVPPSAGNAVRGFSVQAMRWCSRSTLSARDGPELEDGLE